MYQLKKFRLLLSILLLVCLPSLILAQSQGFRATDSAAEFGYSASDLPGTDTPAAYDSYTWYAADPAWHDMWLYDLQGSTDMVHDQYLRWTQTAVDAFRNDPSLNLVHQITVDRNLYEAENYYSSNFPYWNHVEDEAEWEETYQGYEELEFGTTTPELIVPYQNYEIRSYWTQLNVGSGRFTSETELAKNASYDPMCKDEWCPRGQRPVGWMDFSARSPVYWEFKQAGSFGGWDPYHNVSGAAVNNGIMFIDPAGIDPYVMGPNIAVSATSLRYVKLRMASNARDWYGNIYFKTLEDNSYTDNKRVEFRVQNCSLCGNASFYNYSVYMGSNPWWRGTITGIRIDPANSGQGGTNTDSIGFDYIRLTP
jgi:hypothetical protein